MQITDNRVVFIPLSISTENPEISLNQAVYRHSAQAAELFLPAGTWGWANAWVFLGLTTVYLVVNTVVLARRSPQLLNERGKFAKEGTRLFDRVFVVLYVPRGFAVPIVSGLDFRYGWSHMPVWWSVLGVVLLLPAFALSMWAMVINPFFECIMLGRDSLPAAPHGLVATLRRVVLKLRLML